MPKQKMYRVAKIVDHRDIGRGVEYKVHWAGYPSSQDTWEPELNLQHCQEYIQEYIMKSLVQKRKPRRSARLAATPSEMPESIITDELEEIVEEIEDSTPPPPTPPKAKPRPRKSKARKPPPSVPAAPLVPEHREPPPLSQPVRKSYSLRSTTSSMTVETSMASNNQERGQVKQSSVMGVGLSEERFRRQMNQRQFVSSTPYSDSKTKLNFSESRVSQVTTSSNFIGSSQDTDSSDFVGEAELSDDDGPTSSSDSEGSETTVHFKDFWMDLGWKELALASFLSGVGAVGYICYCTDFCLYC